jgi:hypothetical protein
MVARAHGGDRKHWLGALKAATFRAIEFFSEIPNKNKWNHSEIP